MANIDRIVDVQISLNTNGVSKEGFSTMMVVGPHSYDLSRVLSVSSVDELSELGFASDDPVFVAVSDALSQTPRPAQVKVGRMQCDTVHVGLRDEIIAGATYSIEINSLGDDGELLEEIYFYTATEEDDVLSVMDTLAEKIVASVDEMNPNIVVDEEGNETTEYLPFVRVNEEGENVTYNAYRSGEELVIKASDPEFSFVVIPSNVFKINKFETANGVDLAEQMELITAADNDFYGIIYTSRKPEDILAMANWTESHTKLFGTAIAENGCKYAEITTDTGSKLKDGNYFRTFWFYHADADTDYPDAAVMARCFAIEPGGETWANKRLAAITTDRLKESQYQAITKKNGNTFEAFRNITITQNGKVAAGEWIDVIRFRDWLVEEIKTEEFYMLINRDKLPYTDAGIALVEATLNAVLQLGQRRGGIAPTEYDEFNQPNYGYVVTVPKASSISPNVKASRRLTDVKFVARLAGAIHTLEIKGNLTYEALQ